MHERVAVVSRAAREMGEALDALFPAGSFIEDACEAVAWVEISCLRHSAADGALRVHAVELWESAPLSAFIFATKIGEIVREHGLTWGEAARAVHHLSDSWLNVIVRVERHGDREDARADLAYDVGDHG